MTVAFDNVVDMKWDSYALKFELEPASGSSTVYATKTFLVKTMIFQDMAVHASQLAAWTPPEEYQVASGFPVVFNPMNTNDQPILHMQIDAQLVGDSEKVDRPQSVYVTLQKDDQMPYSVHADYLENIKRYQIAVHLGQLIPQQINGDYKVFAHAEDPRAAKTFSKDLGTLQINFNEGTTEATNDGVRDDYKLLDVITNYFPPEEAGKGAAIPLAFSAALVGLLGHFVLQICSNHANWSKLSFWGFVFTLNYLLILGIIVAFWIEINLVNTLWILLAVSPVTLFTMNKGLTPENCHIPAFQRESGKGKSKTY